MFATSITIAAVPAYVAGVPVGVPLQVGIYKNPSLADVSNCPFDTTTLELDMNILPTKFDVPDTDNFVVGTELPSPKLPLDTKYAEVPIANEFVVVFPVKKLTEIDEEFIDVLTLELPTLISENTDNDVKLLPVSNIFVPSEEYNFLSVKFNASSPILNISVLGTLPGTDDLRSLNTVLANFDSP